MLKEEYLENDSVFKSKKTAILLVAGGILVIMSSLIWVFWGSRSGAPWGEQNIGASEIVYDRPLQVQHEMKPADPASVPFLPEGGPQPSIFLPKTYEDLGKVGTKEVVTRDFLIVNRGEAPLTISRAYTTCGCTTAEISANVIPPGKAAKVTLRFDAGFHDVSGQTVRRGLIIESNDPDGWQSEIWMQASVKNK